MAIQGYIIFRNYYTIPIKTKIAYCSLFKSIHNFWHSTPGIKMSFSTRAPLLFVMTIILPK